MIYITSDIHNDNRRLQELLHLISFSQEDHLYILGDLFDRCNDDPDPVGVYFAILGLGDRCTLLRGNHDEWLAQHILTYYETPERKRKKLTPYPYNSFELMRKRLTPVDMQELARWILSKPIQTTLTCNGKKYLLTHDVMSLLSDTKSEEEKQEFLETGMDEHITVFGHESTSNGRIWKNERKNVCCIDCGCGYRSGTLGALCLETMEEFYV